MDENTNKRLGELLIALSKGDILKLEEIYQIMSKLLYTIGCIYFDQEADIEDSIENLLFNLCAKSKRFKINKNACAWIVAVYQNSVRNGLKRRKRELLFGDKIYIPKPIVDELYLENHVLIQEIFDKLTRKEQSLFIYYFWGKFSINEIAVVMKQSKSTTHYQIKNLENKLKNLE